MIGLAPTPTQVVALSGLVALYIKGFETESIGISGFKLAIATPRRTVWLIFTVELMQIHPTRYLGQGATRLA